MARVGQSGFHLITFDDNILVGGEVNFTHGSIDSNTLGWTLAGVGCSDFVCYGAQFAPEIPLPCFADAGLGIG